MRTAYFSGRWLLYLTIICLCVLWSGSLLAHGVTVGDQRYIQEISGINLIPYTYLGAKHMVTGYDHLLFLFGVVFFLYRLRHSCACM